MRLALCYATHLGRSRTKDWRGAAPKGGAKIGPYPKWEERQCPVCGGNAFQALDATTVYVLGSGGKLWRETGNMRTMENRSQVDANSCSSRFHRGIPPPSHDGGRQRPNGYFDGEQIQGMNSPKGCGSNSDYNVTWSVSVA
jgi:hypothetical protein